jgi:hypothetical protein
MNIMYSFHDTIHMYTIKLVSVRMQQILGLTVEHEKVTKYNYTTFCIVVERGSNDSTVSLRRRWI